MPVKYLSVGATEETLLDADEDRTVFLVVNTHANQIIYINDDAGVTSTNGLPVNANYGSVELQRKMGWPTHKKWYVIASGAATTIYILEGFESIAERDIQQEVPTGKPDIQNPQQNNTPVDPPM